MGKKSGHSRKGFALVLALLTASITAILMMAYISRVVADYRFTTKIHSSTAALDLAEAGIERAIWNIIYNGSDFSGWSTSTDASGNKTHTISVASFSTSSGVVMGSYDVSAWVSADGINAVITSTGYVPNKTSYDARKTVKVAYENHNFMKAIGASGTGGITLGKNSIIDSYNSDIGPYAATHTESGANIATNGPIVIPNNSDVYGDANPGADYPFSSEPTGVTGSWGTLQAPLVYDPIPAETLLAAKEAGLAAPYHGVIVESVEGSYTRSDDNLVVNNTVTLTGGDYYFKSITVNVHGNIIVSGTSTIYVDGGSFVVYTQGDLSVSAPTTFYVDGGDINVSTQGDINNSGVPKDLVIYSTGSNITLSTQTDFFGAIYAPNAAISLTSKTAGGEIYGAISCDSFVSGTNTAVHFDKALLSVSPIFSNSSVISWQEMQ